MEARSWVFMVWTGSRSECPNGRNLEAQLAQPEADLEELADAINGIVSDAADTLVPVPRDSE
jgi:hypothetical protein